MIRQRAEEHLRGNIPSFDLIRLIDRISLVRLRNSRFSSDAYITAMCDEFDRATKKRFKTGTGDSWVKFSTVTADRDPAHGIRSGLIKLGA